jgi:hypothetical protein
VSSQKQSKADAMQWNIMARVGLGPIRLGAARARVVTSLGTPLTFDGRRALGGGPQDCFLGSSVAVNYDRKHAVAVCTVWRGGPYLLLGGRCVWAMSRLELMRTLDRTWAEAPADPHAGHWTFAHQNAWFKWEGKRLEAVAVFDTGIGERISRMARTRKNEPEPQRRREPALVP